jgi:hypothetical protein
VIDSAQNGCWKEMADIPTNYRPLPENTPKLKNIERNPVNPSIPSKWEVHPLPRHHSSDGFGDRKNRFNENTTSNPGPGYYYEDQNNLMRKSASLSKKGFGNAFVSKSDRLSSVILNHNQAGPGHYNPKAVDEVYASSKAGRFAQSDIAKGRMPYEDPLRNGPRPGPGEYKVEANFLPGYLRSKPTVAFASQSGRDSFLITSVSHSHPAHVT